jgi:ferritin-like metal-binding protein YciE
MSGELACDDPRNNLQNGRRAMGFFTTPIKTMDDLYKHQLQDIYYAEKQITKGLTEMIAKANNASLKQAFQKHLGETEQQIKRLDEAFRMLGQEPKGTTCPAIDGIISEARELISDCGDPDVCDAAMIAAAQAVEHYEITRYGTLITWSKQLGKNDVARVLEQTLNEEKATDKALTSLAEASINRKAAA